MRFLEWWEGKRAMGFSRLETRLAEESYLVGYAEGISRALEVVRAQAFDGRVTVYDVEKALRKEGGK
jgi:hypothetical protein